MTINPNSNPENQEEEWEVLSSGGEEDEIESHQLEGDGTDEDNNHESEDESTESSEEEIPQEVVVSDIPQDETNDSLVLKAEDNSECIESDGGNEEEQQQPQQQEEDDEAEEMETTPFLNDDKNENVENTTIPLPATEDTSTENNVGPSTRLPQPSTTPSVSSDGENAGGAAEAASGGFLGSSLRFIGDAVKDFDDKHHIRRKTRNSFKTIGIAVKDFDDEHHVRRKTRNSWKTICNESKRGLQKVEESAKHVSSKIKEEADRLHVDEKAKKVGSQAKVMKEKVSEQAKVVGQKAHALNEEHKITDVLTAAAVLGAGVLLAQGKGRAGAAVLASGGAAYMAGEAMKAPYRHDSGLNENIGHHL